MTDRNSVTSRREKRATRQLTGPRQVTPASVLAAAQRAEQRFARLVGWLGTPAPDGLTPLDRQAQLETIRANVDPVRHWGRLVRHHKLMDSDDQGPGHG